MFHCLAQINAWILLVKCANQEALLGVDKALLWFNLKSERISDERGRVKDKEKKDRKNAFRIWNLLSYYTVQKINYSIWLKKKKKKGRRQVCDSRTTWDNKKYNRYRYFYTGALHDCNYAINIQQWSSLAVCIKMLSRPSWFWICIKISNRCRYNVSDFGK